MPKEELLSTMESKEIKRIAVEKAKKLAEFCTENGNPINFTYYGGNFDSKEINLEELDLIKLSLSVFKSYLNGPIFTDNFGTNHSFKTGRREWEKCIDESKDEEMKEYYRSNRLNTTQYGKIVGLIDELLDKVENFEMKEKIKNIKDEIKKETWNLVDGYYIHDKGYVSEYNVLEDKDKVEIITKFSKIVQKLINILENKA